MVTLINLPHEIQDHIANMLRPHKSGVCSVGDFLDTHFLKALDIAHIKTTHRNFKTVRLWKNLEWKQLIHKYKTGRFIKMNWEYKYGILPDTMIKKGWEDKINNIYGHQGCYVKTVTKKSSYELNKIIYFKINHLNLISGIHPLPSCFGQDTSHNDLYQGSVEALPAGRSSRVAAPSLMTLIPKMERRTWLIKCFEDCVVMHYTKNGTLNFMTEFNKKMNLPSCYSFPLTYIFKMFLKELRVHSTYVGYTNSAANSVGTSENIREVCRKISADLWH
jgi:hypothetical protein